MLDLILPTFNFGPVYAAKLIDDIPEGQMCAQPVSGRVMNHGAFSVGHLAWASDNAVSHLGGTPSLPPEWKERSGQGAKPLDDRSKYPTKTQLIDAFTEANARLVDAVAKAPPDVLSKPAPERMRGRFPTVAHLLAGLMTAHMGSHLGQLSAWRRAMGYPSVFG